MPEAEAGNRLLELPWDIRRIILVEVLQHGQDSLPRFNQELIESRVRLRNCFDDKLPKETNFYVPKHKYRHLPSNVLQATNRQLRDETRQLVEQLCKSSETYIPFTLDVMIVKDIGVFPTWTSFPYTPKHVKLLAVNIRIIRPGTSTVPSEWVEVARHEKSDFHPTPIIWNTLMAVVFYALGVFSVKPETSQAPIQPATTTGTVLLETQNGNKTKDIELPLRPRAALSQLGEHLDPLSHQKDVFNAYRLPSAPYITDELSIYLQELEYTVDNEPVPPHCDEHCKDSRFYRDGYCQFGHDILQHPEDRWIDRDDIEEADSFIAKGMYASYQLQTQLTEILAGAGDEEVYESTYAPFLQVLAQSVKVLRYSGCITPRGPLIDRYTSDWTYSRYEWREDEQEGEDSWSEEIIERNLARELAREPRDDEHIVQLRVLQARKAHGWVLEGEN